MKKRIVQRRPPSRFVIIVVALWYCCCLCCRSPAGRGGVAGQEVTNATNATTTTITPSTNTTTNTTTTTTNDDNNVTMTGDEPNNDNALAVVPADCISTGKDLVMALANTTQERANNATDLRTIIICPNTILEREYSPASVFFGNSYVIEASNIHIKCGVNGDWKDNCTLSANPASGPFGQATLLLLAPPPPIRPVDDIDANGTSTASLTFTPPPLENIRIDGITFDGRDATSSAVVMSRSGYLALNDCVFANYRVLLTNVVAVLGNEGTTDLLIDSCRFENNQLSSNNTSFEGAAILWLLSSSLVADIRNTTFRNNNLQVIINNPSLPTWAVYARTGSESNVQVQDCCFINNTFNGPLVSVTERQIAEMVVNNYVHGTTTASTTDVDCNNNKTTSSSSNNNTSCTFLQIDGGECIEADLTTCSVDDTFRMVLPTRKDCPTAEASFATHQHKHPCHPMLSWGVGTLVLVATLRHVVL